ncbi:MAG: hypothetical protein J7621_02785 [Niastella sp.]|nr:hypothetical protein [Niastella sp.]
MITNDEQVHIKACLDAIEAQLNWGSSANWSNYDFEKLADLIAGKTNVQLSVSTLKRVWGKVSSQHTPSLTTLHTLAQYLGYADWRAYQQQFRPPASPAGVSSEASTSSARQNAPEDVSPPQQNPVQQESAFTDSGRRSSSKRKRVVIILTGMLVLLTAIGFIAANRNAKRRKPDPAKFSFSTNKIVAEGVPNTVIFHYDAAAATTDSVYIVQTWDISRKKLVPKNKHDHSAIYYYPGFFRTRLIVDGEVVKSHDVQITSDGWLGLVENEPIPLYFRKDEYIRRDRIEIDSATLQSYNLSLHPKAPKIRLFNQRDLGSLSNDNFTFETKLKNEFSGGTNACQHTQVLIQCKDDIMIIPLSTKACTGDLMLYACGGGGTSKDTDLSRFGADLSQWTTLRVESRNKQMTFFVNGVQAYSLNFPHEPTGIVGVQYRFYGVGAVKDTWFRDSSTVYDFTPAAVKLYPNNQ